MGLILNEWATNSLKYGALASGGRLALDWSVEPGPMGERARLRWAEIGLKKRPDFTRVGFGSRLTRTMVEGALRGEMTRQIGDDFLRMSVTFPLARA